MKKELSEYTANTLPEDWVFMVDYNEKCVDLKLITTLIDFKGKKVLDIGCEDGVIMAYLKNDFGCEVAYNLFETILATSLSPM